VDWQDPSKHGLFCYPESRRVDFMAGVAPAWDDAGGLAVEP